MFAAVIVLGKTEDLLFSPHIIPYCPKKLFSELKKYEKEILEKTKRTRNEYERILHMLTNRAHTLQPKAKYQERATQFSPDQNDSEYLALAVQLKCGLWSNDKALKQQSVVPVYTTHELLERYRA